MAPTPQHADIKFTYYDYTLLPEDKRCELIEGDFYTTPSPVTIHQMICFKLLGRKAGSRTFLINKMILENPFTGKSMFP